MIRTEPSFELYFARFSTSYANPWRVGLSIPDGVADLVLKRDHR